MKMTWMWAWLTLVLMLPNAVNAQEEFPDRVALNVGWLYVYDNDIDFSARRQSGILGTSINFDRDLSGEENASAPRIHGYYRFTPEHRIDYAWYRVERDGRRNINRDISFGATTFPVNAEVDSSIMTELYKLAYTWSFYHIDKVELGLTAGAAVLGYEFEMNTPNRTLVEERSFRSPLPVFGLRMNYTINPRWHALFDYETFYIEFDDKFRGSLDELQVALEYRASRYASVGASLNRLAVDADVDEDDYRGSANDLQRGVQLYVGFHY